MSSFAASSTTTTTSDQNISRRHMLPEVDDAINNSTIPPPAASFETLGSRRVARRRRKRQQEELPLSSSHQPPHVNYAWRSLDRVKYKRYPAGRVIPVGPPLGAAGKVELVESFMILKTRALQEERPLYHQCRHFVLYDACDLGDDCLFIHSVFIASDARLFQKATHYRRHQGRTLLDATSITAVDGRSSSSSSPPRYFFRNPYAESPSHRRVFVTARFSLE